MRATAAGGCCAVAALSYSGAVTPTALLAFVLPAVVLVTVVTAMVGRLSLRLATVSGLLAALTVAEIVNLVSGTAHGPAARSTFAAAVFTVLAVSAALSPWPALFSAGVVGVVVGALGLGAGAEVGSVAVATAVVTVVGIAVLEARDRQWPSRPPQLTTVVVLAVVVGALVATVALRADRLIDGAPDVLAPGAVQPTIMPPPILGDQNPPTPTPSANPPSRVDSDSTPPMEPVMPLGTFWFLVLGGVLTLCLCLALRTLWVALAWRLLRRRLRRGSGAAQVAGAWVWSTRRLRSAGWPMPPALSADAVGAGEGLADLPRNVRSALREVAQSTVDAWYAPPVEGVDPATAWSAADEVGRDAVRALPLARRMGFALRPLTSVPSRSAALAPATREEIRS